jgi:hypothetical protein
MKTNTRAAGRCIIDGEEEDEHEGKQPQYDDRRL